MNKKLVLKILSIVLMVMAAAQIPALAWALYYGESSMYMAFGIPMAAVFIIGTIILIVCRNITQKNLSIKDGFITVASLWISAAAIGAIPFYISGSVPSYTDAFFETMSGFTTTGATVLTNIEALPKSLLFWRSMTHYLGGLGIVVVTAAIFPLLGIGNMRIIKAETTGPAMQKIMPKITESAKILFYIYAVLTIAEIGMLMFGGLTFYDAVTHSMATISTGGFSPKNISLTAYNSTYIDLVVMIFMFLGGVNFVMYFSLITGRIEDIRKNSELKVYVWLFIITTLLIATNLFLSKTYSFIDSFKLAGFESIATITTTGFVCADYSKWPVFAQMILFLLAFSGGCAGSTSGGIKIIRHIIIFKQGFVELKRLLRPKGIFFTSNDGTTVRKKNILAVTGFIVLYFFLSIITSAVVSTGGYDLFTCISAAVATLSNVGPGFGMIGPMDSYAFFHGYIKWFLSFIMLTGRLELYTILILFTHNFWRR